MRGRERKRERKEERDSEMENDGEKETHTPHTKTFKTDRHTGKEPQTHTDTYINTKIAESLLKE